MSLFPAQLSLRKKVVLGTAGVVFALVMAFVMQQAGQPATLEKNGIPLPFGGSDSTLKGAVTFFGKRNGIDVYDVTYKGGEVFETLLPDRIYLVHIPNIPEILDVPLDVVMTSVTTGGRSVNYYGYKYSDAAASDERKNFAALLFRHRFSGKFFASQKAWDEDAQHGNALSAFQVQNGISFVKTDGSAGGVNLDPSGSLYVFIVNEPGGARLFVRPGGICGNGVLEPGEECDDLNSDDTDSCSNACKYNIPIPFGTGSIAAGTKLAVAVDTVAPSGNAVLGQTGITLMRFSAGGPEDTRIHSLVMKATSGSLVNATNYALWVDANRDGRVETRVATGSVASGLLTFSNLNGLSGYPIVANLVTVFEVRGDIVTQPTTPTIQVGFAVQRNDFITGRRESPAVALSGIRLDGTCSLAVCQIAVTNAATTFWTIVNFPVCGNGYKEAAEGCDDGNAASGDGCSYLCSVESGYTCTGTTPSVCTPNAVCGNGAIEGSEACDDQNTTAGDGCSATCTVESGYTCSGTPSVCTPNAVCGNGAIEGSEACDDQNTTAGDGCSATCTVESGYTCSGTPSVCTPNAVCGNGTREGSEACDDQNTTAGDGCSATCTVETGFSCNTATPNVCSAICGDGLIKGAETCDDQNTTAGDGCSAVCAVESGYVCSGTPSSCHQVVCGDGNREGSEECDDGNQSNTDTCTNTCHNAACGDGFIQGTEECDEGAQNGAPGGDCDATCHLTTPTPNF